MEQLALTASEDGQVLLVTANVAAPVDGVPSVAAEPPVLVIESNCDADFVPTGVLPKDAEPGVICRTGAGTPEPLRDAVTCPAGMLDDGKVKSPAREPVPCGANAMSTVQVAEAASCEPQLFAVTVYSLEV